MTRDRPTCAQEGGDVLMFWFLQAATPVILNLSTICRAVVIILRQQLSRGPWYESSWTFKFIQKTWTSHSSIYYEFSILIQTNTAVNSTYLIIIIIIIMIISL